MAVLKAVRVYFPDVVGLSDDEITAIFDGIWPVAIIIGNLWLRVYATKGPVGMKDPECR